MLRLNKKRGQVQNFKTMALQRVLIVVDPQKCQQNTKITFLKKVFPQNLVQEQFSNTK